MENRWLKIKDASQYVGCSINTFRKHFIQTGKVQATITSFGKRYDRLEIDAIMTH